MSYGDEIMALGEAETHWRQTAQQCVITDDHGRIRAHPLWEHHPAIAPKAGEGVHRIRNAPGSRPYIEYPFTFETGCRFTPWRARDHRCRLALTPDELARGKARAGESPIIVIEPHIAESSNQNKQWGWQRWTILAALLRMRFPSHRTVQIGPRGTATVAGCELIADEGFRDGCATLAHASLAVLPEGGLHHAAAALGVPAVVIFGGTVPVENMGYPEHMNLSYGKACGSWKPCGHCADAMARIEPAAVASAAVIAIKPREG